MRCRWRVPWPTGLVYAHEQGLWHGALKPSEVVFNAEGCPQLCDFGIARIVARESRHSRDSSTGYLPWYRSPEQIQGRTGDLRADIYALGILLYEMLRGKQPFDQAAFR